MGKMVYRLKTLRVILIILNCQRYFIKLCILPQNLMGLLARHFNSRPPQDEASDPNKILPKNEYLENTC